MNLLIEQNEKYLEEFVAEWSSAYADGKVFGFGMSYKAMLPSFLPSEMSTKLGGIYDNNAEMQGKIINGHKVLSPSAISKGSGEKYLVYTVDYVGVKNQLAFLGLTEYEDFCRYSDFLCLWHWFKNSTLFIPTLHVSVTTKCTLKCESCNMFMPKYQEHVSISLDELKEDLNKLFTYVDYIQDLEILGGEPLLYKELSQYIQYIYDNYSSQIGAVSIITNGTLIPDEELMRQAKRYNIRFVISDYTPAQVAGYPEKLEKLLSLFEKSNIHHRLSTFATWKEFDASGELSTLTTNELRDHYIRCSPPFKGLANGRFYPCHITWSADLSGKMQDTASDYIDLSVSSTSSDLKYNILRANMGWWKNGHLALCQFCRGCDAAFPNEIPVARQVKKG